MHAKLLLAITDTPLELISDSPNTQVVPFWKDGNRLEVTLIDIQGSIPEIKKRLQYIVDSLCDVDIQR